MLFCNQCHFNFSIDADLSYWPYHQSILNNIQPFSGTPALHVLLTPFLNLDFNNVTCSVKSPTYGDQSCLDVQTTCMAAYQINQIITIKPAMCGLALQYSTDSFCYDLWHRWMRSGTAHIKKRVLITIRVGFDLLKSNLLCDYTPGGFLSSDQPCKSISRQFTNQMGICDSWFPLLTSVLPSHRGTQGCTRDGH